MSRLLNSLFHIFGLLQGRDDDNIDTIRRRFEVFQESTLPVVQYYEKRRKLRRVILGYFDFCTKYEKSYNLVPVSDINRGSIEKCEL